MKLRYLVCLIAVLALTGCATVHREQAPEMMFNTARPVGFNSDVRYVSTDPHALESHFSEMLYRRRAVSKDGVLNILALSGGGAGGSFGAGGLVGLSLRGDRPQFDLVTGISAGALMAPFAFLGPSWNSRLADAFSGGHGQQFLDSRGIDILFRPGLYRSEPLFKFVDQFVTDELIREVAREAGRGRMLLVATTDLDKEETVIWDMGQIAAHGGEEARALFRNVLAASASIPGMFSPVLIPVEKTGVRYDEMHADGGVTTPFFFAPALAYVLPLGQNALKGANIYVLINGQLGGAPHTTKFETIPILARSFSAALKHMGRTEVAVTSDFARRYGMNFRLAEIPVDYPFRGPLDFQESSMRALFNYGVECAREGRFWATLEQAISRNEKALTTDVEKNPPPAGQPITPCPLEVSPLPSQTQTPAQPR